MIVLIHGQKLIIDLDTSNSQSFHKFILKKLQSALLLKWLQ